MAKNPNSSFNINASLLAGGDRHHMGDPAQIGGQALRRLGRQAGHLHVDHELFAARSANRAVSAAGYDAAPDELLQDLGITPGSGRASTEKQIVGRQSGGNTRRNLHIRRWRNDQVSRTPEGRRSRNSPDAGLRHHGQSLATAPVPINRPQGCRMPLPGPAGPA